VYLTYLLFFHRGRFIRELLSSPTSSFHMPPPNRRYVSNFSGNKVWAISWLWWFVNSNSWGLIVIILTKSREVRYYVIFLFTKTEGINSGERQIKTSNVSIYCCIPSIFFTLCTMRANESLKNLKHSIRSKFSLSTSQKNQPIKKENTYDWVTERVAGSVAPVLTRARFVSLAEQTNNTTVSFPVAAS
jgi:hypothetical protein